MEVLSLFKTGSFSSVKHVCFLHGIAHCGYTENYDTCPIKCINNEKYLKGVVGNDNRINAKTSVASS